MTHDEIAARIPHAGRMCLLDEAVSWDKTRIHCRSETHLETTNPLRRGRPIAAVHLIEYAAQAAALHYGLQAEKSGAVAGGGMLVGLNQVDWSDVSIADINVAIDIRAEQALASARGLIYYFDVGVQDRTLVRGRLSIALHA